jgi:hypothetical protein
VSKYQMLAQTTSTKFQRGRKCPLSKGEERCVGDFQLSTWISFLKLPTGATTTTFSSTTQRRKTHARQKFG